MTARSGSSLIMNLLFDYGAKIDMKKNDSKYPLKESLRCGHIDCFRTLIERGVRPTATLDQRDFSPLMIAIKNKELHEAVPILIANGESVNTMTRTGFCPLFLACRMRSLEIVKLLCDQPSLKLNIKGQGGVFIYLFCFIRLRFIGLPFLVFPTLLN